MLVSLAVLIYIRFVTFLHFRHHFADDCETDSDAGSTENRNRERRKGGGRKKGDKERRTEIKEGLKY